MREGFVYALVDPFTDEIRYVGCTIRLQERFRSHLKQAANPSSRLIPKIEWLRSLNGVEPMLLLLETVEESKMRNAEKAWILNLRAGGARLTNQRVGGVGGRTNRVVSEETRQKMRQARSRQVFSEESKQKMSVSQRKRWAEMSKPLREQASQHVAELGRRTGAAAAAKGHEYWRGAKHSDESRQRIRAAKLGRKVSEEQRHRIYEGHQNEDYLRRASLKAQEVWSDPDRREAARQRAKAQWSDPEYRSKMFASRDATRRRKREAEN